MIEKKRGRPKKDILKSESFIMRMTKEEKEMLEHLIIETGMSGSEILLKSLKMYYNIYAFG